jgi:formate--tetrahydrofolate ligase
MASNIQLARTAKMRPIQEIALNLGIPPGDVHQYGPWKAKISLDHIARRSNGQNGKADPGYGDDTDAGRRGQEHHNGWS